MVLLNAMLVIQFIMVTSLCRTQHVCWLGSPWAVLHPLAESHDGRTRRVQRKQAAHRAVRSLGIFFPPLEMALKDDSTTATIKLLMAEMRRLGDRIEGRCVGIEHSIGSVLTASASATTYDEPRCAAGLLFGEELIFLDGPVFDKEPFIFDEEPVFFSEGLIFDKEPGLDEETSYSAAAGVSVVCFDEGPIFDEEPGDFTTTGCGVVLFDGPDVSTAMVGHNSTASPRQASTTSNVNEELVLGSDLAARALVATVAVPSNSNINATSTCSTKCLSRDIDIVAPTVAYTISEEVAVVPVHIPSPPTTNGTSTSIGAVAFGEFNFKHVPAPVKATDVSSPKLLAEVELNTSPHDNHLTVCLSHNTNVAGFAGVTGPNSLQPQGQNSSDACTIYLTGTTSEGQVEGLNQYHVEPDEDDGWLHRNDEYTPDKHGRDTSSSMWGEGDNVAGDDCCVEEDQTPIKHCAEDEENKRNST